MCGLRRRQRRHEQRRWSVNSGGWVGYDDRRGVQYHNHNDVHNQYHNHNDIHNQHYNYDDVYNHHHDGS